MDGLPVPMLNTAVFLGIQLPFIAYNVVEGLGYNKQLAMQRQRILFFQCNT